MTDTGNQEQMNIVIAGHVDHGKSTIIGRMLADTGSLPDGKLDQVRALCERNSKPFEYAFLLDALKDEMAQGITIDAARVFFHTAQRDYLILDAPGHIEFLKNMVTGASRAEAALLVIDADEGVRENSRRHGYLLAMLGISQVAVVVNKMDLVAYRQERFEEIRAEYTRFLAEIGVEPAFFIPVSGREGDWIAAPSERMKWFEGPSVLEGLDRFRKERPPEDKPFRMPVQDIYKFTEEGDKRRLVAGTVDTGSVAPGDEIIFYPSGKRSRVHSIEAFNADPPERVSAGQAAALTLDEQIYITRGEMAARAEQPKPRVTTRLQVSLFWMGRKPLTMDKEYLLKIGTAKVPVAVERIIRVLDASSLDSSEERTSIERHDVAECILSCRRAVAFDLAGDIAPTSRFVLVDDFEISGGGIVRESLEDAQDWVRNHVIMRNMKWETGMISREQRAEQYNQKPVMVLVSGPKAVGKKTLAKTLEARLFSEGKIVYFMGIANVLYGVDADIKVPGEQGDRREHIRRTAEVANLLLDAGMILLVTAVDLSAEELQLVETTVGSERILTVWLGERLPGQWKPELHLPGLEDPTQAALRVKRLLQDRNIVFKP